MAVAQYALLSALIVLLFISGPALAANVFYQLVGEVQQYQQANPNVCGQDTQTCGIQNMVEQFESCKAFRIVNGCPVGNQATYGWQVGIIIGHALCSGTLLSPQHVSLAAHCVDGQTDPGVFRVYIGALSLRDATPDQIYTVQSFSANPNFNAELISNDAALLKLDKPVNFDANGVRPACLPTGPAARSLKNCVVGGYGLDNWRNVSGAGRLRYTVISALPDRRCTQLFGSSQFNPRVSFCAIGTRARLGSDSCGGDSGSGVVCKDNTGIWRMYGLVSYGPEQCGEAPGVYSDVYQCGITAPTSARDKAPKSDRCIKVAREDRPNRPRPVNGHGKKNKKTGGIGSNVAETLLLSGCTANSECESNVCKPVEVCNTTPAAESTTNKTSSSSSFRTVIDILHRPSKAVNQAALEAERPAFARRQCLTVDVCWLSSWVHAYTDKPVFDFGTVIASNAALGIRR